MPVPQLSSVLYPDELRSILLLWRPVPPISTLRLWNVRTMLEDLHCGNPKITTRSQPRSETWATYTVSLRRMITCLVYIEGHFYYLFNITSQMQEENPFLPDYYDLSFDGQVSGRVLPEKEFTSGISGTIGWRFGLEGSAALEVLLLQLSSQR